MKQTKLFVTVGILLAILIILFFMFGFTKPPEDATRAEIGSGSGNSGAIGLTIEEGSEAEGDKTPVSKQNSFFEFEGYGPGKSHIGTFDDFEATLTTDNGKITGIEGTIQANSVNTGIGGLDSHLLDPEFFDATAHPQISFTSSNIGTSEVTGVLTFRGVSQEITFPATLTSTSVSADFVLDTTPFNMNYAGVNKEVRIAFDFSA